MTETIKMSNIINAEMQHEIDAVETARKWREWCKKAREEGILPKRS
jgi:hypothetical protein